MQTTSLEAYRELCESGKIGKKQDIIFNAFRDHGNHTNLEISKFVDMPINTVTPRTNELVKLGILREKLKRKCQISGRKAIVWGLS